MRWFHRHRWKVVSASCDGMNHWWHPGNLKPLVAVPITEVVRACECGELRHDLIPGNHKLEALRGEDTEIAEILKTIK